MAFSTRMNYREIDIDALAFHRAQMQFGNFDNFLYGSNNRRIVTRSGNVRNQCTTVCIDQNEARQAPSSSCKPNEQFLRLYTAS